mmetsp:Transcript_49154/g.137677  ORF Transcript_49154/g.137677 Transcript_49154/m.137677 type:complete len:888 (+) Transcript_49154:3-2666(+)
MTKFEDAKAELDAALARDLPQCGADNRGWLQEEADKSVKDTLEFLQKTRVRQLRQVIRNFGYSVSEGEGMAKFEEAKAQLDVVLARDLPGCGADNRGWLQDEADTAVRETLERLQQAKVKQLRQVIRSFGNNVGDGEGTSFDDAKAELDATLTRDLPECGVDNRGWLQEEADKAARDTKDRIEAAARQKAEEERRKKEQAEMAERLLKDLTDGVVAAEAALEQLREKASNVTAIDGDSAQVRKVVSVAQEAETGAWAACKSVVRLMLNRRAEFEEVRALAHEPKQKLIEIQRRIHGAHVDVAKVGSGAKLAGERALRRERAKRIMATRAAAFKKYDKDEDGFFNSAEIRSYAQGEFGFQLADAVSEKILSSLSGGGGVGREGVPERRLVEMRKLIGIAREEAASVARVEAAARWRAHVAARRAELEERLLSITDEFHGSTNKVVADVEAEVEAPAMKQALTASGEDRLLVPPSELGEMAGAAKKASETLKVTLSTIHSAAEEKVAKAGNGEETFPEELREMFEVAKRKLNRTMDELHKRADAAIASATRAQEVAAQREQAELEEVKVEVISVLRKSAFDAELKADGLLALIDKDADGAVSESDFQAFFAAMETQSDRWKSTRLGEVFASMADATTRLINKEDLRKIVRVYYRVRKQTVLTEGLSIKDSKTIRRLEPDEFFEADGAPQKEETAGVMRVRGRATRDGKEGFVTIMGNQGAIILEEDPSGPSNSDVEPVKETNQVMEWDPATGQMVVSSLDMDSLKADVADALRADAAPPVEESAAPKVDTAPPVEAAEAPKMDAALPADGTAATSVDVVSLADGTATQNADVVQHTNETADAARPVEEMAAPKESAQPVVEPAVSNAGGATLAIEPQAPEASCGVAVGK